MKTEGKNESGLWTEAMGFNPSYSIHQQAFRPFMHTAVCCTSKENVDLATVFFLFNFKNEACVSTDR